MKKSQITVFIILGIITVAIFAFMFFLTQELSRIKLETEANRIVDSILATTPLNYYVTLCLEESTKRALNISGRQGGPIYTEDYAVGIKTGIFEQDNISYGIINDPDIKPPQYPCKPGLQYYNVPPAFCGFLNNPSLFPLSNVSFGVSSLKPLCNVGECDKDDINISVSGEKIYVGIFGADSIQKSFEKFIAEQTQECAKEIYNIPAFQTFNITTGNISVKSTFGFNGIEIVADFPLIIKIQDVEPVIRILKFNYFSPVRYKSVYKFARYLAEKESRDLNFEITKEWENNQYFLENFIVQNFSIKNDTLIRIIDNDPLHYLRNGPFIFQFMIENRPPALDYIEKYDSYTSFIEKHNLPQMYDIVVTEFSPVVIMPSAKDPDGDELLFNFSGWKEDYDEFFDDTKRTDCRTNPSQCITRIDNMPHNWSTIFLLSGNISASLPTNHSDIGPHNVTVCVYEKNNIKNNDCQTIRVLVDDVFIVIANISKCYEGIENKSLISIEDPLCLDSDIIDYFNPGITQYSWKITDTSGIERTIYSGYKDFVVLPLDYEKFNHIPGKISYFSEEGIKKFILGVERGSTSGVDEIVAYAKKCIPHRSNSAPYPFNLVEGDSFEDPAPSIIGENFSANHSCCLGDIRDVNGEWYYASKGTVCYNYTQYGLWNSEFLNIKEQIEQKTGNTLSVIIQTSYPSNNKPRPDNYNITNDIIMRSFLSHCSGVSGNSCLYDVTEYYANVSSCSDSEGTYKNTQFARCEGAPRQPQNTEPRCEKYTDTTFEQKYLGGVSANCNVPRCTDANFINKNNGYGSIEQDENAYFLCNATCYNGACQKPFGCINCRSLGNANKEGGKDYTFKQTTIWYAGFCSKDSVPNYCSVTQQQLITDMCQSEDILIEFFPSSNYENQPLPYDNETIRCSDIEGLETEAIVDESGCLPGKKAICYDGACVAKEQFCQGTNCDLLGKYIPYCSNERLFIPFSYDSNNNGIAESCIYPLTSAIPCS
ncbi:MAG: hypothetical protein QXG86_00400 [Candidatus Woesearchaeota archaeon]